MTTKITIKTSEIELIIENSFPNSPTVLEAIKQVVSDVTEKSMELIRLKRTLQ